MKRSDFLTKIGSFLKESVFAVDGLVLHRGASRHLLERLGEIVGGIEGKHGGNVADRGAPLTEQLFGGVDL